MEILNIGCGNSEFSAELFDIGFKNITNLVHLVILVLLLHYSLPLNVEILKGFFEYCD